MKVTRLFIIVVILCSCIACNKKPEELFEEEKSGVVLICNEFYYDISLANGEHIYFTGLDAQGNIEGLTSNLEEIKKNPNILNGTGFFIDHHGRILTNRHVVAPQVDKDAVRKNLNVLIEGYAEYIESLQDSMSQRYNAIQEYARQNMYEDEYGDTHTNMDEYEVSELRQEIQNLQEQYSEAQELKNEIRSNVLGYNFTVQLHSQFGIAYDGSNINKWSDFMKTPCELQKVSSDQETDLALLQLKSKVTPEDKYVFDYMLFQPNIDEGLEINQSLYMIGYNHGVELAKTNRGINAQFTSGTMTQKPDGNRILYSIPAMPGSSGAPIIDDKGRLVAVNFAGSNGSDNFNFGIPMMRIVTFLK